MNRAVAEAPGRGSLRRRLLIGTIAWIAVCIVVAGWGLARLFSEHVTRQFDADLAHHLDQLVAVLDMDASGAPVLSGGLSDPRFTRPYSGFYWQVDQVGAERPAVLRSRSLWDAVLPLGAAPFVGGEDEVRHISGPEAFPLRVILRRIVLPESPDRPLLVAVAAEEALLVKPIRSFTRMLLVSLGALGAGLLVAVLVQVRVGLRPLVRLGERLVDLREGRANEISGRFPGEIQPLVEDFNAVLRANAGVVERARTQAGNLAHALKTPLAVLANAAAGESGPFARLVDEQVRVARQQVDIHLRRARAAASVRVSGQRTPVRPVLEGLVRVMQRVHAERDLHINLHIDAPDCAFRGELQDLQEMAGNLLDNACKWAMHAITIRVEDAGPSLRLVISDDGPGVPAEERESVFARGVRIDEATPGSGLGLAIARELAQLYGGDVVLDTAPTGGAAAILTLPRAR